MAASYHTCSLPRCFVLAFNSHFTDGMKRRRSLLFYRYCLASITPYFKAVPRGNHISILLTPGSFHNQSRDFKWDELCSAHLLLSTDFRGSLRHQIPNLHASIYYKIQQIWTVALLVVFSNHVNNQDSCSNFYK